MYLTDTKEVTAEVTVIDPAKLAELVGTQNEYLTIIEESLSVVINPFGSVLKISGQEEMVAEATAILENLATLINKDITINSSDVVSAVNMAKNGTLDYFLDLYSQVLIKDVKGRAVRVKTFGQRQYVNAIKHNDITFGIGPAGTGKTFLAVVMAISALKKGLVEKIVLTRLGFGSKMIVNGDISQIDLPNKAKSGLVEAQHILQNLDQIEFVEFTAQDVVRHPVVARVINAYENFGK